MHWIKASERLPDKSLWPELHYNADGVIAEGQLMDNEDAGIVWFEQKRNGLYKDIEDLSRVEWLDEGEDEQIQRLQNTLTAINRIACEIPMRKNGRKDIEELSRNALNKI